ncbi:MAG TPA: hypothetical protein VNQ73_17275, partial [Ilumatobacter sp.]|nr:hypothetical protein [Ilumatobacter sp.]
MTLPRWALRLAVTAILATAVAVVTTPATPAHAAQILSQGQAQTTTVASCTPGFAPSLPGVWGPIPALLPSPGINAWAEHYTDPQAGFPGVNQQYRMRVAIGAPGDPCATQAVGVSAALGPNTTVTGPIRCGYFKVANNAPVNYSNCQNALQTAAGVAPYNLRVLDPLGSGRGGSWLVPNGEMLVIEIPVTTTVAGSRDYGFDLRIADGMSTAGSWIQVKHTATVYGSHAGVGTPPPQGGGSPPAANPYCNPGSGAPRFGPGRVGYPGSPPKVGFHTPRVSALRNDGAVLWSFLEPQGTTGRVELQLRLAGDNTPANWDTVEICFDRNTFPSYNVFADASGQLAPNTAYQWRVRYFPEYHNGSTWVTGTAVETPWSASFRTLLGHHEVVGASDPFRPEAQVPCTATELTGYLNNPSVHQITFDCPRDAATGMTKPVTLQLTQAHVINRDLEIDGGGLVTLKAAPNNRLFEVTAQNARLTGLTITGGTGGAPGGGAVLVWETGTLTVNNSVVHGNQRGPTGHGGAFMVRGDGTPLGSGELTIMNSVVSDNHAVGGGAGAVYNQGGLLVIANSEFSGNTAYDNGGAIADSQTSRTRMYNVTFARNRVAAANGTLRGSGGAVQLSGFVQIRNATFAENAADYAGALRLRPSARIFVDHSGLSIGLANLTVVGNRTTNASSGAVMADQPTGGGGFPIQIRNSVIAGNTGGNCATALTALVSHGGNVEDGAGCGLAHATDRRNANLPFSQLGSWGELHSGFTRLLGTHVPLHGSAAIGAGMACGQATAATADWDANYRLQPETGPCDSGAVQVIADGTAPAATAIARRSATPTTAAQVSWTVEFSEGVVGVDAGDFTLAASGRAGAQIVSVTPIGQVAAQAAPDAPPVVQEVELPAGSLAARYRVTATAGTGNGGSLGLNLTANAGIWDAWNTQAAAGRTGPAYTFTPSGGNPGGGTPGGGNPGGGTPGGGNPGGGGPGGGNPGGGNPGGSGTPGNQVGAIEPSGRVCFAVAGNPGDVALVNLTPVLAEGAGNGQLVSSDITTPPNASN